jgi:aerobic carbon-monoxide dehydrogenase small subunit
VTRRAIRMSVNGREAEAFVDPRRTLADVLREDMELTGTHLGCEHGVCGACTILLDGAAVRACLMLGVQADGAEVTTIEGVAGPDGELHPLQEAFRETHGFQCGFCTPGFVMSALALLEEGCPLDDDALRDELAGNICRCTGYQSIIDGVKLAAERLQGTNT